MRYATLLTLLLALPLHADEATDALAKELRDYATAELAKVPGKDGKYRTVLPDYLNQQLKEANARDRAAWSKINTKADWEKFRDERVAALRKSLGTFPEAPKSVPTRVTRTIEATGYAIDNLLYESRPGVWVTGNLYRPATPQAAMPVILIAHSHHAPKEQGELQDMGVTWAKLGCMVLVIDQLGHGERRQHPFATAKDYPKEFRVGRQDYYFRYNLNLQLSLVGDSLMGWMAWDLMRGLDVCLARPGADKKRVILLGAVAAGGDVAAVTAALDSRITCVVPFNFGGPQPETRYPLPENAEEWFNYVGSGSWESTRNLRDSAADGFLPWMIVASVAPRRVIHAHEFSWDRERDPVWKRYQKVWGFYDANDNLSFTTGTGQIQVNDDKASHCTNIGPIQRKGIYAALKKWFDIPVPEMEAKERRPASELKCWTDKAVKELKPEPLNVVLGGIADGQAAERRAIDEILPLDEQQSRLTRRVGNLMGSMSKRKQDSFLQVDFDPAEHYAKRFFLYPYPTESGFIELFEFVRKDYKKRPPIATVFCVCQEGINRFLKERATAIAILIEAGSSVCVIEFVATGGSRPGNDRSRSSAAAAHSSTAQMLREPLLNERHFDFAEFLSKLVARKDFIGTDFIFWGESLAPANEPKTMIAIPHDLPQPCQAEPLGPILATTWPWNCKAIVARGGLVSYRSVLDSPFIHVPHDALPINVFRAGDLPDVWAHLAPKPLRLEGLVDGTNRRVTGEKLKEALRPVAEAYKKGGLVVDEDYSSDAELAKWIVEQLKK